MASQYIHTQIIPQLVKEKRELEGGQALEDEEEEVKALLKQYGLTAVCISTVYRWLKKLGVSHEPRRKGYYVDGHEKEETIAYRYNFIERYFTYERRAPRWIQITKEEAYKLEEEGDIPKGSGFHYNHPETGVPMVEYHVDMSDLFQKRMGEES